MLPTSFGFGPVGVAFDQPPFAAAVRRQPVTLTFNYTITLDADTVDAIVDEVIEAAEAGRDAISGAAQPPPELATRAADLDGQVVRLTGDLATAERSLAEAAASLEAAALAGTVTMDLMDAHHSATIRRDGIASLLRVAQQHASDARDKLAVVVQANTAAAKDAALSARDADAVAVAAAHQAAGADLARVAIGAILFRSQLTIPAHRPDRLLARREPQAEPTPAELPAKPQHPAEQHTFEQLFPA